MLYHIAMFLAHLLVAPFWFLYAIKIFSFTTISQLLSLVPGKAGILVRRTWYAVTLEKCGKHLTVDFLGAIRTRKTRVGDNDYIGIGAWVGLAEIGDNVLVSGHSTITSGRHQHGIKRNNLIVKQKGETTRVKVGSDVWIGDGSRILADVSTGCVVGAGSVVTKTFPEYSVIGGNPADLIRKRE
ncbi:acyltransferase [archaeon]|nr:acyltransferase [archaeon]